MKAAVFHSPGKITYDNMPDPEVTSTAICGSDLHILSGAVPQKQPMIMGHGFMGIVKEEKVVLDDIITHRLPLSQVEQGYKVFHSKEEDCIKVILKPGE